MADPRALDVMDVLVRASSGVGKVRRDGRRGVTLCDVEEIEAMALLLALLGLPSLRPDLPRSAVPAKADALSDFFNTFFDGDQE